MQDRKQDLLKALAKIIKQYRGNHSISKLSHEVDVSKSIWSNIEQGHRDIQFTTLWRISEALNIKLSNLVCEIEKDLGSEFSFIEDIPAGISIKK
ncbi:MAG: helix-turn-helix transcriptional regulator [Candidatus Gastranaerophilales bacterium]|nr:helix-turn-helix transcriptional regulator [Candidatus Gastranaerophilales bacterium]